MLSRSRWPLLVWLSLWPVLGLLVAYPVRNSLTRHVILGCLVLLWLGGFYLLRKRRVGISVAIICSAALLIFMLLPGRPHNTARLRSEFVHALERYQGVRYVWGGESFLGVDCSGLIRGALVDAHVTEGVRTANPALLREAMWLWYHDATANALKEEWEGRTKCLGKTRALRLSDQYAIEPGDFAVTSDGIHTLAYLGDKRWIEADPSSGRVITLPLSKEGYTYFNMPVHLLRWRQLSEP